MKMPENPASFSLTCEPSGPRVFFVIRASIKEQNSEQLYLRVLNIIRALQRSGLDGDYCWTDEISSKRDYILGFDVLVLARSVLDEILDDLIRRARHKGIPVVYDLDDCVFDPSLIEYFEQRRKYTPDAKVRHLSNIRGNREALDKSEFFTASTTSLTEEGAKLGLKAFHIPNTLSREWLNAADHAKSQGNDNGSRCRESITIGYFPGTFTHQKDFSVCLEGFLRVLRELDHVRFLVSEFLDLTDFPELSSFRHRIVTFSSVPWQQLPLLMSQADIAIAPLELHRFCECKSELKYLHAASLKIPIVASPTRPYTEAIEHGKTGFVARSDNDWYSFLKELVVNPARRSRMGANAYDHVMDRYTEQSLAGPAVEVYRRIAGSHGSPEDLPHGDRTYGNEDCDLSASRSG